MTSSYNDNIQPAGAETPLNQYPMFQGPEDGDTFVNGSRVWIYNGADKKWDLQHIVVRGEETIKQGPPGEPGKSAYDIWLDQGNVGTEQDFLDSLKGEPGTQGERGAQGVEGRMGATGLRGISAVGVPGPRGASGEAICEETVGPPDGGPRGKLWIDENNQIYITLGG